MDRSSLDDLVRQREEAGTGNPYRYNPFGFSREGRLVNGFFKHLQFFSSGLFPGKGGTDADPLVIIRVEPTETGLLPPDQDNMPYGWEGKINSFIAEMAVWWAFEILTEDEGREFLQKNHPVVHFTYNGGTHIEELTVKYNGISWIVLYNAGS